MNKYLVKIAATRTFKTPEDLGAKKGAPHVFRNLQWDGKKTIDPNSTPHANRRAGRLEKAKSLLSKKRFTVGTKVALGVAGAAGAYHLGKSILNNLEP